MNPRARIALAAACALAACRAAATSSAPASAPATAVDASILDRIDVYRAEGVTAERIVAVAGPAIARYSDALAAVDLPAAEAAAKEISPAVRALGDFAFVDVARIEYYDPPRVFITVDLVEQRDAAARMRFRDEPTGDFDDPGGLLAQWSEYERIGGEARKRGEIHWPLAPARPFHQLWGFELPALAPFLEVFERGVPLHRLELERILREDRDAQKRASAAYLLAHVERADELTAALVAAMSDASSLVRNNAMRVLADATQHHAEVDVPIDAVVEAMDYPTTTDRNKSAAILAGLAKRPALRREIARKAGPRLLALLALKQPNNHDWAYTALTSIRGEPLDARDVDAWRRWLESDSMSGDADRR